MSQSTSSTRTINWKQVGLFLGLTIITSWLLDWLLWRKFGYGEQANLFFQLQMLIPAAVIIVLQRYFFRDSPLYFRTYRQRPRWFFNFFLLFTLFFVLLVALTTLKPALYPIPIASLVMLPLSISLLVLIIVRVASGKDAFQQAGLAGGKRSAWLLIWLAVMGYLVVQVLLNMASGLGFKPDLTELAAAVDLDIPSYLVVGFANSVVVGPFLSLVMAFGEEYGWRGYLQSELVKLGRIKGVLLVGLIWGIWHAPAVTMGHNYPGYPILGPLVFLIFSLLLAIFLGYVVLKSGSVWLAAFAHAVFNSTYQWLTAMIYTPNDPLFSFGIGVFGILIGGIVSLIILRDQVWRSPNSAATEPRMTHTATNAPLSTTLETKSQAHS